MSEQNHPPLILITGGSGFVGKYILANKSAKYRFMPVSLREQAPENIDFTGVHAVLHLAGLAHQMQKVPDQLYFDINTTLTARLADAAKSAGVPHFLFVSTIKAFGEREDIVLKEDTPCDPVNDPYGQSKLDAELYLGTLKCDTFKVSIVRPPLIYGPEVKGNLIRLLGLSNSPWPLPFGGIDNRRTMVSLANLQALLFRILDTQKEGLFLASDRNPISTSYLIRTMRKEMGRSARLFALPGFIKNILSKIKPELSIRLFGSLEMDPTATNQQLQFTPPQSTEDGLLEMINWYKSTIKNN
jgi:nucleoside-diphosphate-sugar epimerase